MTGTATLEPTFEAALRLLRLLGRALDRLEAAVPGRRQVRQPAGRGVEGLRPGGVEHLTPRSDALHEARRTPDPEAQPKGCTSRQAPLKNAMIRLRASSVDTASTRTRGHARVDGMAARDPKPAHRHDRS